MFKQVKSALFWYYLYKFRRRVVFVILLLLIALFSNAIYSDIVEYLKLKNKLEYLEILLLSKWSIILFNITFSIYLILTMFKKDEQEKKDEKKEKKQKIVKEQKSFKQKDEKFTDREKQFLYKKKLKNKSDVLVNK